VADAVIRAPDHTRATFLSNRIRVPHSHLYCIARSIPCAYASQSGSPKLTRRLAIGSVPPLVEVENEAMMVESFNLSVDQLEDLDIHGSGGERIGEVEEVLMSPEGEITALSVEVGSFLRIDDKEVVMELNQLRREGDAIREGSSSNDKVAIFMPNPSSLEWVASLPRRLAAVGYWSAALPG